MKKKILTYALSALACLTSCSDWLDINHDPNTAEKVDPGYLFNYVAVNWAGTRTGGDFYIPLSMSSQCQDLMFSMPCHHIEAASEPHQNHSA